MAACVRIRPIAPISVYRIKSYWVNLTLNVHCLVPSKLGVYLSLMECKIFKVILNSVTAVDKKMLPHGKQKLSA